MCEAKDFPSSERDELMGLVTQLQGQVAQLTAAKEELHKQVAELKRAGKRQAAPFSKGGRSSRPKRPGRKPGMGSFSYRKSPSPDEVTEPLVEVAVAEVPRPQVTGYRVGRRVMAGGPRAPLWSGRSGTEGPRCAQSADWCGAEPGGVQRCSGPHPFLLNPSSHSAPLINYGEPEANITSAVRDFLVLTGLVKPGDVVEENPPGLTPHSQTTPSLSASFMYWYAG